MEKQFFAKSVLANGTQPTVKEHLDRVAELSAQYGAELGLEQEARLAGQLHDFGKYSKSFQNVLRGTESGIDHAICGATYLHKKVCRSPKIEYYKPIMEVINGHHDGLLEFDVLRSRLCENAKNPEPQENNARKLSALSGMKEYQEGMVRFKKDYPAFKLPALKAFLPMGESDSVRSMLYTRMLFSCLVDADYSASALDENPDYLLQSEQVDFDAQDILQRLYQYREQIRSTSKANSGLNRLRDELFEKCGQAGDSPEGLFTLTAPTGTGKTMALLHFALRHCLATGKRRVIVVLPFLTLTEQTVNTYRNIYPDILEDNSQANHSDEEREFTSRWRVPFIVTTSVRFFETLFSHKPTDCRKLHNLANSVVIFDEAQSLPADLTSATLQAVNELCKRYHTTMVFSTATQPDFSAIPHLEWTPQEILPDNARFYQALHRTIVHWNTEKVTPFEVLVDEIAQQESVCAIVNLRKHANKLYERLKEQCPEEEVFYLTTNLCAAHRQRVIRVINERLKCHQPCRVVATQCIEAGVDFDFDVLYRALAPLESIIQAAGRCNRNGRLVHGGEVTVFVPDEKKQYPSTWYETATQKVENLLHNKGGLDISHPQEIQEYYRLLFQDAREKQDLTKALKDCSFAKVNQQYKLIPNQGVRVIVPYEQVERCYAERFSTYTEKGMTPRDIKEVAPITVTVGYGMLEKLKEVAIPIYYRKRGRKSNQESGFYILYPQYESLYKEDVGLQLPEPEQQVSFDPFL